MTIKPAIWHPIAVVLGIVNLVGAGFAAGSAEPWHATLHSVLAVAFGLWAHSLRKRPGASEPQAQLEELESRVNNLQRELSETTERLNFTERLLAQGLASQRESQER